MTLCERHKGCFVLYDTMECPLCEKVNELAAYLYEEGMEIEDSVDFKERKEIP